MLIGVSAPRSYGQLVERSSFLRPEIGQLLIDHVFILYLLCKLQPSDASVGAVDKTASLFC